MCTQFCVHQTYQYSHHHHLRLRPLVWTGYTKRALTHTHHQSHHQSNEQGCDICVQPRLQDILVPTAIDHPRSIQLKVTFLTQKMPKTYPFVRRNGGLRKLCLSLDTSADHLRIRYVTGGSTRSRPPELRALQNDGPCRILTQHRHDGWSPKAATR